MVVLVVLGFLCGCIGGVLFGVAGCARFLSSRAGEDLLRELVADSGFVLMEGPR